MFDAIGAKIKGLTKLICWVGIIASVISGGAMLSNRYTATIGIIVMILGSLLSWVGSFLLYGFGELIDQVMRISDMLSRTSGIIRDKSIPTTWKCAHCGQENTSASAQCKACGKYRS